MACAPCNKRRAAAQGAASVPPGTYRVMVGGSQVFEADVARGEEHAENLAKTVAGRYAAGVATIIKPDGTTLDPTA